MGLRPYHWAASACSTVLASRGCTEPKGSMGSCGSHHSYVLPSIDVQGGREWRGSREDDDCTKAQEILLLAATHWADKQQLSFSPLPLLWSDTLFILSLCEPLPVFITCLYKQNNFYSLCSLHFPHLQLLFPPRFYACLMLIKTEEEDGQVQLLRMSVGDVGGDKKNEKKKKPRGKARFSCHFCLLRMISLSHRDIHMSSESLSRLSLPPTLSLCVFLSLSLAGAVYKYPWHGVHSLCTCVLVKTQGCKALQAKQTHVGLQRAGCKTAQALVNETGILRPAG